VLTARLLVGVKIAVLFVASRVTAPETGVAPGPVVTIKVSLVIVAGAIALLKIAVIFLLIGTPVAASAGLVEVIVGATAATKLEPIELLSEPPPQPATNAVSRKGSRHISRLE
jgi:hypothetical protein